MNPFEHTNGSNQNKGPIPRKRAMTIEKARKLWGKGHEELSDQQFQDMIDLFYTISIGLYENRLKY